MIRAVLTATLLASAPWQLAAAPAEPPAAAPLDRSSQSVAGAAHVASPEAEADRADASYRFSLAKLLDLEGSLAAAEQAYESALELAGDDAFVHAEFGDFLARRARTLPSREARHATLLSAAGQAERAFELAPDDPDVLRTVAEIYLYLADERPETLGRGVEVLETLRELTPWDLQMMVSLGQIYMRSGRTEEAAEVFDEVAAHTPGNRIVYQLQADALFRSGRWREGGEALARLLALDPEDVEIRARLAGVLLRSEEWEEAIGVLEPLLAAEEASVRVSATLFSAEALSRLDRTEEALELLARAGEEGEEGVPQVEGKRVELLLRIGEEERAAARVRDLLDDESPEGALTALTAYQQLGRFEQSIPLLDDLVDRRPDSVDALFMLGAAHERVGEVDRAARVFRRLLGEEPDHAPTLNYLGYMWADRGENLKRALALVERAVALDPDNGSYVDSLGWAHYRLGNYEEAREQLERAVDLIGEDPVVLEHLGDVYAALGDDDKAVDLYRRSLEGNDTNAEAVRRKLSQLLEE